MLSLTLGSKYQFTLKSGRKIMIVIHGSQPNAVSGTEFDIFVDGVPGKYASVDQALGEAFTNVALLP